MSSRSPDYGDSRCRPAVSWVDAHVHVFPPDMVAARTRYLGVDKRFDELYESPDARMATAEEVLAQTEANKVDLSVIFGFAFSDIGLCRSVNDYVIEMVRQNPSRLAGLACVPCDGPGAATELERCLDAGLCGCGELAPVSGDHERLQALSPVVGVLRERGLPLLVHASEPVGHEYPGKGRFTPEACIALAKMYPGLKLVLSHLGGGAFVYESMPEVKQVMADVFYDTAAIPYLYSPGVYIVAARAVGAEKLIFGSDYPLLTPDRCAIGTETLSPQERAAVMAGNARRVYGI